MSHGPSPFPPPPPAQPPAIGGQGLHPLTIGRVFELSWRMYRFRWQTLLGTAAIILVPLIALQALAEVLVAPVLGGWGQAWEEWAEEIEQLSQRPDLVPALPPIPPLPPGFWEAVAISLGVGLLGALASALALAALIHAVGKIYIGQETSATEAAGRALRRTSSVIGAQLLRFLAMIGISVLGIGVAAVLIAQGAGLPAFLGVVLLVSAVVLLIVVMLRWMFAEQAIMLEGQGAPSALARSWRLVGGSIWRVLGYALLLALTIGLLGGVFLTVVGLLLTGGQTAGEPLAIALQFVLYGAFTIIVTPFSTIYFTLLYYDIRWRKGELGQPIAGQPAEPYGQPPYGWSAALRWSAARLSHGPKRTPSQASSGVR